MPVWVLQCCIDCQQVIPRVTYRRRRQPCCGSRGCSEITGSPSLHLLSKISSAGYSWASGFHCPGSTKISPTRWGVSGSRVLGESRNAILTWPSLPMQRYRHRSIGGVTLAALMPSRPFRIAPLVGEYLAGTYVLPRLVRLRYGASGVFVEEAEQSPASKDPSGTIPPCKSASKVYTWVSSRRLPSIFGCQAGGYVPMPMREATIGVYCSPTVA